MNYFLNELISLDQILVLNKDSWILKDMNETDEYIKLLYSIRVYKRNKIYTYGSINLPT